MSEVFTVRPARPEEVETAAELLNEHSRRLYGKDDTSAEQLRQYWESPDVDCEQEVLVAEMKDGALVGYATEEDRAVRDLYEGAGYRLLRHSFHMEVELEGNQAAPVWPEGVAARTLRPGEENRVYEAHMESFADTWLFTREPFHLW